MSTSPHARRVGIALLLLTGVAGAFLLWARADRAAPASTSTNAARVDGEVSAVLPLEEDGHRYLPRVWSFGLDRYALTVEDTGFSKDLAASLRTTGADLVVNGGFFDPNGQPVGLAMSSGKTLSTFDPQLSGGVLLTTPERAKMFITEGLSGAPDDATFAIQCRPQLVVDRVPNIASDDHQRAERTALCIRDDGRRVDAVVVRPSDDGKSEGPSLFAFARWLAAAGCRAALNLDGGPSTGAAWREGASVGVLAPRGPVRHVVAFHRR